jgi:hypothetical protein
MFKDTRIITKTGLTLLILRGLSSTVKTGIILMANIACIPISKDTFLPTIGGDKYCWCELKNFGGKENTSFVGAGRLLANQLFITLLNMQLNKGIVSFHVNIYITAIDGTSVHRVYNITPENGRMTEQLLQKSLRGVASCLTGLNIANQISTVKVVASFSL